jgi:hypothetical protein
VDKNRVRHEVLPFFAFARVVRRGVCGTHARRRSTGPDRLPSKGKTTPRALILDVCA